MIGNHCVILAGGLGTRLIEITAGAKPKALVEIGGIPFLHFKLLSLIQMGFTSVDVLVGQHGDQIGQFLQDSDYHSIKIRCYSDGPDLLGTAGAIASILHHLPATFWVSYADSYLLTDIEHANRKFDNEEESVMVVLHNQDRIETSNVSIDETRGYVTCYVKNAPRGTHEWIDYGITRFAKSSFQFVARDKPADLSEVVVDQIRANRMRAFTTNETFWDIGTPDRLSLTTQEFRRRGWI